MKLDICQTAATNKQKKNIKECSEQLGAKAVSSSERRGGGLQDRNVACIATILAQQKPPQKDSSKKNHIYQTMKQRYHQHLTQRHGMCAMTQNRSPCIAIARGVEPQHFSQQDHVSSQAKASGGWDVANTLSNSRCHNTHKSSHKCCQNRSLSYAC